MASSARFERSAIRGGPRWSVILGTIMLVFGLVYPHFLEARSPVESIYAAPMGLIPCPTLSVMVGLTLMLGGLGLSAWMVTLAMAGLFYGVFGVAVLGVHLDAVLIAGAIALLALLCRRQEAGD